MSDPVDLPPFDLNRFTPYRLAVAAEKMSEMLARQYREEFGISIPEWRVLVHLAHTGGISVRDIQARAGMEKSKVSRAASRLERSGHVTKVANEEDRRLVHLTLTPKGRRLMAQLLPMADKFQSDFIARMGAAMEGLETGLDQLLKVEKW